MEDLKKIVGKNIQYLRKENNLTQQALAEKLNYTSKAISKWERGESIPEIETLIAIASFFKVTVDYLLHENANEHSKDFIPSEIKDKNILFTGALAITIVWMIATIIFVYLIQQHNVIAFQVFMWAIPISLLLICFYIKKRSKVERMIVFSILLWTILIAAFIQFIDLNLYLIFLVGLPAQLALFLWSKIIVIK